jgi:hypothetical protein
VIHLIRGELIKTVNTRALYAYALAGVALAVGNVLILTLSEDLRTVADKQEAIAVLPVMLLVFGLVGAAGEHRHRTAAPAVLAAGKPRAHLLLARVCAYAVPGMAVGAVTAAAALAVGLPMLASEPGPGVGMGRIVSVAVGGIVGAVLCTILGVAAGALVRNQVVGVVGALILMFVVTPLLNAISEKVLVYTPFGAGALLAGDPHTATLSQGGAALVLVAWTAAVLAAAVLAERWRDLA